MASFRLRLVLVCNGVTKLDINPNELSCTTASVVKDAARAQIDRAYHLAIDCIESHVV